MISNKKLGIYKKVAGGVAGLTALATIAALSGCASGQAGSTPAASNKGVVIAQTIPTLNDPWYVAFSKGSKDMADALGVSLEQVTNPPSTPYDPAAQISAIENLIAGKPDVIQIDPTSTDGINGAIDEARKQGIKVVTDGIHVTTDVDSSVVADNLQGGEFAGKYMADALGSAGGSVAILEGQPGRDIVQQRKDGFVKGLANNPAAKVVSSQVGGHTREGGQRVTENVLQGNKDLTALWAAADTMSIGALEAFKTDKLDGKVLLGGFNGDPEALQAIADGKMLFTIDQVPYEMGAVSIALSYLLATGGNAAPEVTLQTKVVDKSNVQDYLGNVDAARAKTIDSVLTKYGLSKK
jgi:ribose transport system substrate-binding protein